MIYSVIRGPLLRLLRAPTDAPEAPAGSHDSVRIHRASPRYLTYRLLGLGIAAAIIATAMAFGIIASAAAGEPRASLVLVLIALVLVPVLALPYLSLRVDYDLRYYVITDRSLRVREGAWRVCEKTISYANVQNLHVHQGPLQRLFRISTLKVETAGGGGSQAQGESLSNNHQVQVAGIENAAEMRDQILAHLRRFGHGAGLGDHEEAEHAASVHQGALASSDALVALGEVRASAAALRATAEAARATAEDR